MGSVCFMAHRSFLGVWGSGLVAVPDAVFFHMPPQGGLADAQPGGGGGPVAVALGEGLHQLDGFRRTGGALPLGRRRGHGGGVELLEQIPDVAVSHGAGGGGEGDPLQEGVQLDVVARPGVVHQQLAGLLGEDHIAVEPGDAVVQAHVDGLAQVLRPAAQGREKEPVGGQQIVELGEEILAGQHRQPVLGEGGDDPDLDHSWGAAGAGGEYHRLPQQAAESVLPALGEHVRLVHVESAAVGVGGGPGEGLLLIGPARAAVEGDEGTLGAGAGVVDALGEEGLAAAHLPQQENGLAALGEGAGQLHQPLHLPAGVAHVLEPAVGQVALEPVALPQGVGTLLLHAVHLVEGEDHPFRSAAGLHRGGVGHHRDSRHLHDGEVELPALAQGVQPHLRIVGSHELGQGEALQPLPGPVQNLAGHVVDAPDDPLGVQLDDAVKGVVVSLFPVNSLTKLSAF